MPNHCTTSHKHGQFYTYPTNLVSSAGQQHVASQALPQSQAPVVNTQVQFASFGETVNAGTNFLPRQGNA
jgi:glucose/arabinose dehydrogenase